MPNRPWVFCALLCVLPFEVLCPAQSAPPLQENCSGEPKSFWVDGRPLLMRLCGGVAVFVIAEPLDRNPLAYAVAIRNVSKQPIDIHPGLFTLMDRRALDPRRVSAHMRKRAAWSAAFAGMGESLGHNSHSTVYGTDGSIATVDTHTQASSAEIDAAEKRAAGPLRRRANVVESQALKRNTVFPGGAVVGMVYFQRIKKLPDGRLRFAEPGGPVLEFPVRLNAK